MGFRCTQALMRSSFTSNPSIPFSPRSRVAFARIVMDWRMLCAVTGSITLSWNSPRGVGEGNDGVVADHLGSYHPCHLRYYRVCFPRHHGNSGCRDGSRISASPATGPLFIHRRSLAIFMRLVA